MLCVNSGEKVKNFKILNSDKGFTFNKKLYKNIESIVRALKKDPLQGDNGKAYNLGGAAPKPQDEQEVIGEENEFEELVSAQCYLNFCLAQRTPVRPSLFFRAEQPHRSAC